MNATMEMLEAAPPGTAVTVEAAEWQKVEGGLMRNGVTLSLDNFIYYLNQNKVIIQVVPWEQGRWYYGPGRGRTSTKYRLVCEVDDGHVHGLVVTIGNGDVELLTWPETDPVGDWTLLTPSRVRLWMTRMHNLYDVLKHQVPEPMVEALHRYAERAGDVDFDQVLDDCGIGRAADHVVKVHIQGHSLWPAVDALAAQSWLGGDVTVNGTEPTRVNWFRDVEIIRSGVGCVCDDIHDDDLAPYLPSTVAEWDFTVGH